MAGARFPRIDDDVPEKNATTTECFLCGGVVNCDPAGVSTAPPLWAPVGERATLKIIHRDHAIQVVFGG